jgi:hypothetical protein
MEVAAFQVEAVNATGPRDYNIGHGAGSLRTRNPEAIALA